MQEKYERILAPGFIARCQNGILNTNKSSISSIITIPDVIIQIILKYIGKMPKPKHLNEIKIVCLYIYFISIYC